LQVKKNTGKYTENRSRSWVTEQFGNIKTQAVLHIPVHEQHSHKQWQAAAQRGF